MGLFKSAIARVLLLTALSSMALAALPREDIPLEMKSSTRTFNHKLDFAIDESRVWVRDRLKRSQWAEIEFPMGSVPFEIKADGANLMVRDTQDLIHYKKVLKEMRMPFCGSYSCRDISGSSSWMSKWFSIPVMSWFQLPWKENRLRLPPGTVSWAVSHRGKLNRYFEDAWGIKHYEFPMVTTVYAIPPSGDEILFADPFLPGGFSHSIELPEGFVAEKIDASASMIFVVGRKQDKLQLYTRLADFDTLGKNPMLPGFWHSGFAGPPDWNRVLLPKLHAGGSIINDITIFQTGEGNDAREIRVSGTNRNGQAGYFRRSLPNHRWQFAKSVAF